MARTIVISDTHAPRSDMLRSVEELQPIMGECDRLLVNGDLAELGQPLLATDAAREVHRLEQLAHAAGIQLILLCGNHDPEISPWRAALFAGGRILVTHGDSFHTTVVPWARHANVMREAWNRIRAAHDSDTETIEDRFDATRGAALAEIEIERDQNSFSTMGSLLKRPRAVVRILRYWHRFPRLTREFASVFYPQAEWAIVGHTHRQRICRAGNPTVINTGSFGFPGRPLAVILDEAGLRVQPLVYNKKRWQLDANRVFLEVPINNAGQLSALDGPLPLQSPCNCESRERVAPPSAPATDCAARTVCDTDTPVSSPMPSHM